MRLSLLFLSALACSPAPGPDAGAPPAPELGPPTAGPPAAATESPGSAAPAGTGSPIRYDLSFGDRAQHMVDVQATLPVDGAAELTVWMPAWTPGSYLIREYARHVEGVQAHDPTGTPLDLRRSAKNRWTIQTDGAETVVLRYRVYGHEMSVRTNWVDQELAVLNGAALFITLDGPVQRPHRVVFALPSDWPEVATGLDLTPGGGRNDFLAADLDELLDSPMVLGTHHSTRFDVNGAAHRLVHTGELGPWDTTRSAEDVQALVTTQLGFWGDVPYQHYSFLNVLSETRGGLEHLDSTLMMTSRAKMVKREDYIGWLGLVSHEFFHTWNIKRLRPRPLGPFDYEHEVYTPSLWVAEGLTSYYDDLLLVRAGLITEEEYLELLGKQIGKLQGTHGRKVQTLQAASAEAWIKYYRPDENSTNTSISYYTKGAIVGFLLDARIRAATGGAQSLDDVMVLAYQRYGGDVGYTPEAFEAIIDEVAGAPQTAFLDLALRSTEELSYDEALATFGLRFGEADEDGDGDGDDGAELPEDPAPGWLGAELGGQEGRQMVEKVPRDTPAHAAGLNVGDELVSIDGWRVPTEGVDALLAQLPPGKSVQLGISRRGKLQEISATLGAEPEADWTLSADDGAEAAAVAQRGDWLGTGP